MITPDPITAAIVIGSVAVASSTGAAIHSGLQQSEAADAAEKARKKALKGQPTLDPAAQAAQAQMAITKQQQRASGAYGRSDSILTGPLGRSGSTAQTGQQSLLGL